MITTTDYERVEQRGNLDTSTARVLTIDDAGMAAILHTLTNMYGDPALAVVREYSCNAWDSHVEAGQTRPIEVTLPTRLNPQLQVRDYGIGLSEYDILNVFANYGSSTKRNTNDLIGAMGIGAKSAFTVGNQFTVTAVKDHIKTVAIFAKNDEGAPTVDILVSGEVTDEENGVLVDIGVENISAIRDAASNLFRTWQPGTVLVDGTQPHHVWQEKSMLYLGEVEGFNFHLNNESHSSSYDPRSYFSFVMGGIEYGLTNSVLEGLSSEASQYVKSFFNSNAKFYISVPIGAVEITPSREELRTTHRTTEVINKALLALKKLLPDVISKAIEKAPTFTDAARQLRKFTENLGWKDYTSSVTWHGKKFERITIELNYPHFSLTNVMRNYERVTITRLYEPTKILLHSEFDYHIFVTGVPAGKETTVRRYVKLFLEDRDPEDKFKYKIVASPLTQEQIDWFGYGIPGGFESIAFEDFRDLGRKLMKANPKMNAGEKYKTQYLVPARGEKLTISEILALKKPIAVYAYNRFRHENTTIATDALKNYIVVRLTRGQQIDTFFKRLPSAKLASSIVHEYAKSVVDNITNAEKAVFTGQALISRQHSGVVDWFKTNIDNITNPTVLDWAKKILVIQESIDGTVSTSRIEYLKFAMKVINFEILDMAEEEEEGQNFVSANLPLLYCYICSSYTLRRYMDQKDIDKALVDYVNGLAI